MEPETKKIVNNASDWQLTEESEFLDSRRFLRSLGKWSLAVIGGVTACAAIKPMPVFGWVNRRGSWMNGPSAVGWANRGDSWLNGGSRSWGDRHG
jgi:hypothetical protein